MGVVGDGRGPGDKGGMDGMRGPYFLEYSPPGLSRGALHAYSHPGPAPFSPIQP